MKKRYIIKSVTKFVVFDTKKRTILKGEYTNIQSADRACREANVTEGYLDVLERASGDIRK